jgi:hypothetical protein
MVFQIGQEQNRASSSYGRHALVKGNHPTADAAS